jgi:hypothetical protein
MWRLKKKMKKATAKIMVLAIFLALCAPSRADRPLERAEILRLFADLTAQPQSTWIASGTIGATHTAYGAPKTTDEKEINNVIDNEIQAYLDDPDKPQQTEKLQKMKVEAIPFNVRYNLSNEYTMVSDVVVRYDGTRFYWSINVNSRTDSLAKPVELEGNAFTTEFSLRWNKLRVFAWNGEKRINYYRPGNHATIRKEPGAVRGPLTAGVIPWGYGDYALDALSSAESSATEVQADAGPEIHLTVINGEKEETFILDPAKDYAVKFYSAQENSYLTVQNYANYQAVSEKWCPGTVTIERYDASAQPSRLLSRDSWDFNAISNGEIDATNFVVDFEYDAFIEDFRFGDIPLQFRYLPPDEPSARNININDLLQDKLEILFSPESAAQNCATIALRYACGELGLEVSRAELGQMVHGADRSTTMFEMQQFVRNEGLDCVAVETDLETLKTLRDCQVILHLPRDNHYVVLAGIDDKYVRLIDLDTNQFYYRNNIKHFENIWDNTALVVSNRPTPALSGLARIDDSRLHEIVGAACEQCNTTIQTASTSACVLTPCGSTELHVFLRKGCGSASYGTCSESDMPTQEQAPCAPSSSTGDCTPGTFTESGSIWACS